MAVLAVHGAADHVADGEALLVLGHLQLGLADLFSQSEVLSHINQSEGSIMNHLVRHLLAHHAGEGGALLLRYRGALSL